MGDDASFFDSDYGAANMTESEVDRMEDVLSMMGDDESDDDEDNFTDDEYSRDFDYDSDSNSDDDDDSGDDC